MMQTYIIIPLFLRNAFNSVLYDNTDAPTNTPTAITTYKTTIPPPVDDVTLRFDFSPPDINLNRESIKEKLCEEILEL